MQILKVRTKVEIVSAVVMISLLVIASAAAITRTITDSSDNSYTFIRNSKGNYWAATGANIQAAIDDLGYGGGTVWLPNGTLTITSSIYLNNNVALAGAGVGSTKIYSNTGGSFIPIRAVTKENITVRDMTIDMNNAGSNCIYITERSKNIRLQDLLLANSGFQSIYITANCTNIFISGIKVERGVDDGSHGIAIGEAKNVVVDNCILYNADYDVAELGMDIGYSENVTINNIVIYGGGWHNGMKFPFTKNLMISNVVIHDAYDNGIRIYESNQYVSISNFLVQNSGNSAIAIYAGASDIVLTNGFIRNTKAPGKGLEIIAQNVSVSNVEISDSEHIGLAIGDNSKNIQLSNIRLTGYTWNKINTGASNIIISDSIFSYGSSIGLSIDGTSNFKIVNCIFERNTGDGIDTTNTACNNYTITSCTFKYNARGIDCNANDDCNIITLNHFIGDTLYGHSKTKGYIQNNIGIDI